MSNQPLEVLLVNNHPLREVNLELRIYDSNFQIDSFNIGEKIGDTVTVTINVKAHPTPIVSHYEIPVGNMFEIFPLAVTDVNKKEEEELRINGFVHYYIQYSDNPDILSSGKIKKVSTSRKLKPHLTSVS